MTDKQIYELTATALPVPGTASIPIQVVPNTTDKITVQQLRQVYSITDYGAVGDGVTDDMSALIAAVAAAKAAGGGTVYIPNTPNGYYLRRNAGCDVSGSDGISIISDGATLKLQGGTVAETNQIAVFYANGVGCSNFTVSGLRFVSASQVIRYGNGGAGGATHFDPEAAAGRADINETTSFRDAFNLQGPSKNVVIDNCYFGPGIYAPISIKKAVAVVNIIGIQLSNLIFDGTNASCVFMSSVKNATISNITALNHQGCGFDHVFYFATDMENIVVSNVAAKNDVYTPDVGVGSVFHLYNSGGVGIDGISVSSFSVINYPKVVAYVWAGAQNVTFSSVNVKSTGVSTAPAFNLENCENVTLTGLVIEDCPWPFGILGGKNVVVSDFVVKNAYQAFAAGTADCEWKISDGIIIDAGGRVIGGAQYRTVLLNNNAFTRRLKISNVDFICSTYVPTSEQVRVNGANASVELIDCRFRSEFGTSSAIPLLASFGTGTGTITVDRCSTSGYSVAMTYSGANGLNTIPFVAELPQAEVTLTANSATPSVSGNQLFVTANTLATSITNFTNGVQGQQIYVRVNDANTTFDFTGSSLKGNGGVDFTAASGDLLMATKLGSNWYCTLVDV